MALNNTELRYYDSNVLRLPADKRGEYHKQVDRLIDTLRKNLRKKAKITITKIVKAGSFAKYTILRRTSADPVDVDVVFYVSGGDASVDTLNTLNSAIYDILIDMYPNKSVEDFEIQRKATPSVPMMMRQATPGSLPLRAEGRNIHGHAPYL